MYLAPGNLGVVIQDTDFIGYLLGSRAHPLPFVASTDGSDLEGRRQIVVDDQHNLPWDVVLLHGAVRLGRVLPVIHG